MKIGKNSAKAMLTRGQIESFDDASYFALWASDFAKATPDKSQDRQDKYFQLKIE